MIYLVENCRPMKGRLLVEAIKSSGVDQNLGVELAITPSDTVTATVVQTSDPETYPIDCIIMYDRIHGKNIQLVDAEGVTREYKVVQTADVAMIIL